MNAFQSLLIPAVLFFVLGVLARVMRSDLKFPEGLSKGLSLYLLMAIGLKGGAELAKSDLGIAFVSILVALALGFLLPVIAFGLLRLNRKISAFDAAAIAAHYGSVSAATFLTAVAFLEAAGIAHESYPIIMMVVMESPAIIVGLLLAAWVRGRASAAQAGPGASRPDGAGNNWGALLHEAFTNGSVVVLIGSMIIGAVASPAAMAKVYPFSHEIFMGVLCLFLLDMGMEAARRMGDFRRVGLSLVGFGVVMPLIGGTIGVLIGHFLLGFSTGGSLLVGILGASASYIAVPPAMRFGVPEANPSFYLTLSLGVTFPFNVVVGIPLFFALAGALAGGAG